jgi:uncharacterized lipoprotein YddW (UPF0748 family)
MIAPRSAPCVRALALTLLFAILITASPLGPTVGGVQASRESAAGSDPTASEQARPGPGRRAPARALALAAPAEVRALWVLRTSLTTPDRIARLVRDARESGFNTLLVQVRGRGDAYFAHGLEPRPATLANAPASFDPLARTLTLAHAAGLRVHAWVNVNLVASATMLPRDPSHVIHAHPEWLMVPRALAGELMRVSPRSPAYVSRLAAWTRVHASAVEGLYTSPIPAPAAHHLEAVVTDLARRYPLDGVHLDYVRYPRADFDYGFAALDAFRTSVVGELSSAERARLDARLPREPLVYADTFPDRWARYRRARLTDLVARLRSAIKRERPRALVSAAVIPNAGEATSQRLQDWQDWATRGLLDAICPMAYNANVARFSVAVHSATRSAAPQALWAGIGAYRLNSTQTVAHINAARAAGAHGIALFSYDSLTGPTLRSIGRTAFGEASLQVASVR